MNGNGDIKVAHKLFWWGSVDNMDDARIPAKRELDRTDAASQGFMDIPNELTGIDLPFK